MHRAALAIQQRHLGNENATVATTLDNLGKDLWKESRLAEAETTHLESLAMRRKLLGSEHPDVASSLNNLGRVLKLERKLTEAETRFREGLFIERRVSGNDGLTVAMTLKNLADVLWWLGNLDEAEQCIREALNLQGSTNENLDTASSFGVLGMILCSKGELVEAEAASRKTLALRQKFLHSGHPDIAYATIRLAQVLRAQNRLEESKILYREAMQIWEHLANKGDALAQVELPTLVTALQRLSDAFEAQGNSEEARVLHQDSVQLLQRLADKGGAEAQNSVAWLMATYPDPKVRDGHRAVEFALRAIALTVQTNDSYLDTLAAAYAETGDFTNAINIQKEAIAMCKSAAANQIYLKHIKFYETNTPYRER